MEDTKKENGDSSLLSVSDALEMYETYKTYWSDNYREAAIDLKMASGDPATHWGEAYAARLEAKKLTMVINELPQFIHQVSNDIRQNTPSINTLPDADGDIETSEAINDIIRGIEYKSGAEAAYDTGADGAIRNAIGFMRVDHDYCYDDSDEQELLIKRVPDPLSCWIDPASVEVDGRDAMGGIALEAINNKDFKRKYPGKQFISFIDPKAGEQKDSIVIGEIFIKEISGTHGKTFTIHRYKFSGDAMLEKTTFPGDYVPLVPVYGEEFWIDGKRILASLIRQARDPQLRLNHWACKEQELLNMAPIAPVMAVRGTLVNDRRQWQSPGTETVLEYELLDIDGNQAPAPTRLQPPPVPTGIINAMEGAKQNIKESLGMYNASIGEKSNETSGIAIQRRQHEGDVATFHYPDNVRRSITQVGRIIVSALPVIYDTPRLIQGMDEETEPKMIGINGMKAEGQKQSYDLTKGKYHVRVTTGTSYTTKRQEAAELYGDVIKANPELMQVIGDLWAKNLDVAGAQAMADRLRKTIPPQLLEDDGNDPRMQQLMQALQQQQAQIQQLTVELQSKQTKDQADLISANANLIKAKAEAMQVVTQPQQQAQSPQPAQPQSQPTAPQQDIASMSEGQIMAYMQDKRDSDMQAQQDNAMQAQMQAEQEAQESQRAQVEAEQRNQQAVAVIQTLSIIAQQINDLTQAVAKPKRAVYGQNGEIVEVV